MSPTIDIAEDGTVTFANRRALVSKDDFPKGCTIKCKWQWTAGDPGKYPDHFAIVLRTNGKQRKWPHEAEEGFVVKLNPSEGGFVQVSEFKQELPPQEVARKRDLGFGQSTIHDIEVTDGGDKIIVKVDGKDALDVRVEKERGPFKVAMYNREPVAGIRKVSRVTDLHIKALK